MGEPVAGSQRSLSSLHPNRLTEQTEIFSKYVKECADSYRETFFARVGKMTARVGKNQKIQKSICHFDVVQSTKLKFLWVK